MRIDRDSPAGTSRRRLVLGVASAALSFVGASLGTERRARAAGDTRAAGAASDAAAPVEKELLVVQPFGIVEETDLAFVERALAAFYAFRVERRPAIDPPRRAYYPPRSRYKADKLLDFLGEKIDARVLGVLAVDISTSKPPYEDWGILGLGTMDGRTCVISSFRCKRRAPDPATATVRLGKTAVHEIGHTLGLEHCPTPGCLMQDAQGSVLTSDGENDLCEKCRAKLLAKGREIKRTEFRWQQTG